jgi:hypothetical protein
MVRVIIALAAGSGNVFTRFLASELQTKDGQLGE